MKFIERATSARAKKEQKIEAKRPNTSAGLQNHHPQKSITEGRTKEVLIPAAQDPKCCEDLRRTAPVVEIKDGGFTFLFPTPTPTSPGMPPHSATFQYSPWPLQQDSPRIGVAIGSPSNAPPNWGRSFTADYTSARSQQPPSCTSPPHERSDETAEKAERRRKKSSWKAFGSIFRKSSKPSHQEPLYEFNAVPEYDEPRAPLPESPQIQTLVPADLSSPLLSSPRPTTGAKNEHGCASSLGGSGWQFEACEQTDRTSFMPLKARITQDPGTRGSTTPSPCLSISQASKDMFTNVSTEGTRRDSPLSERDYAIYSPPTPRTPRLDLDLAEIRPEFERFSIMFAKQLATETKSSLLERRQSRLQGLRSGRGISESAGSDVLAIKTPAAATLLRRSLTSPSLTGPLSIRTDERCSKTATALPTVHRPRPIQRSRTAPSSVIPPLSAAFGRDRSSTLETLESSPDTPHSDFQSDDSLPTTPTTVTTCTDTESVKRALEWSEPAWDMVTSKAVKVVSPVQEEQTEPYPRVKSPEDLERQLVQVSVARPVSVIRARSRVSKALATTQPLKPRVIELNRNRKSTAAVLVSPGDEVEQLSEPVLPQASERDKDKKRSLSCGRESRNEGEPEKDDVSQMSALIEEIDHFSISMQTAMATQREDE